MPEFIRFHVDDDVSTSVEVRPVTDGSPPAGAAEVAEAD
jgi:hypothetical protein